MTSAPLGQLVTQCDQLPLVVTGTGFVHRRWGQCQFNSFAFNFAELWSLSVADGSLQDIFVYLRALRLHEVM